MASASEPVTSTIEVDLVSPDLHKRRSALSYLEKNAPQISAFRPLVHCICNTSSDEDIIARAGRLLGNYLDGGMFEWGKTDKKYRLLLNIVWTFHATYPILPDAYSLQMRVMNSMRRVCEDETIKCFFEGIQMSGLGWVRDGLIAVFEQVLKENETTISHLVELEKPTIATLVHFLSFIGKPSGINFRALPKVNGDSTPDVLKFLEGCIGSTNEWKQAFGILALRCFQDVVPKHINIELGKKMLPSLSSKNWFLQQQSLVLISDVTADILNVKSESDYLLALKDAFKNAFQQPNLSTHNQLFPILQKYFLNKDSPSCKFLVKNGIASVVKEVALNTQQGLNHRVHAMLLLHELGEKMDEVFTPEFANSARGNWGISSKILMLAPYTFVGQVVQARQDAASLFTMMHTFSGNVILHPVVSSLLVYLYTKLFLGTWAPKEMDIIQYFASVPLKEVLVLRNQNSANNTKFLCYGLLSIANSEVREHIINCEDIPLLLPLLRDPTLPTFHRVCLVNALSLIAFCSTSSDFVKCGGFNEFSSLQLGNGTDFEDAEDIGVRMVYLAEAIRRRNEPLEAKSNKKQKSKKKSKQSELPQKYSSAQNQIRSYIAHLASTAVQQTNIEDTMTLVSSLLTFVTDFTRISIEVIDDYKFLIDCLWIFFSFCHAPLAIEVVTILSHLLVHWTNSGKKLSNHTHALLKFIPEIVLHSTGTPQDQEKLTESVTKFSVKYEAYKQTTGTKRGSSEIYNAMQSMEKQISEQGQQVAQLNAALKQSESEIQRLKQEIKALEESNAQLQRTNQELASQIAELSKPIPADKLIPLARQSGIEPLNFIPFDTMASLQELRALKDRFRVKLRERKGKIKDTQREVSVCPICMDQLKNTLLTPCGHALCSKCSKTILSSNGGRCPICRLAVEMQHVMYL